MSKFALVVTGDARYLAGINAMLNAMKYYGMDVDNSIEFHLIHSIPESTGYIQRAKVAFGSFFHPVNITEYYEECRPEYWSKQLKHSKSSMKYARWWYPVDRLSDYDCLCVLDADRIITNNLTPWFDMIARSDMIGLAANDWSDAMYFSYDDHRAMIKNPPLYSNPYFITGRRAKELFPLIPEYAENPQKYHPPYQRPTTGDMHPVNLTLLQTGMIKDLYPLPATQWVFVQNGHVMLKERVIQGRNYIGSRKYIGIHENGDLIHTIHRRYWGQRMCERLMNGHTKQAKINAINNTKLIWDFYKFFNTQLYLKIEWIWGDFPEIPKV